MSIGGSMCHMDVTMFLRAATCAVIIIGIQTGSSAMDQTPTTDQTPPMASNGRNRLSEATSPYLLQHQANPVHWYQWGEEAFEAARSQNKPIFLSIGYSTCYWCHVMERECFEDQEVADWLNKLFIAIKVDREERPDIDEIYMTATQLITRGRGGWPISLFLEPNELKPFFGGTYFPKHDRGGRRGLITLMTFVHDKWTNNGKQVSQQADIVANAVISRLTSKQEPTLLTSKVVEKGISSLLASYDSSLGGFSNAPKFPMPIYADFLMEAGWDIPQVRKSIKKTLDSMFMGGMYDQVGGGFHRYSTDAKWLVPHFEKMLYDNGLLTSTYAKAYELTGEATYAKVIEETLDYVNRELSAPDGGFFSAQDAETNHLEGETYLWRESQIREVLDEANMSDDVDFALSIYGVDRGTNFQDPHHPEEPPTNVLFLTDHPSKLASNHGASYLEFQAKVDSIDAALLAVRDTRDQPITDDKIITAWNGIMMTGFADAGRVLENPAWVARATRAANFILSQMKNSDGTLLRTWRDGKAGVDGFLIDYASLIRGLLAIHEANLDKKVLADAVKLYDKARELFYVDGEGWYDTQEGQSDLFVRTRAQSDGAMPAATSLILTDLVKLSEITRKQRFLNDAMSTLDSESQLIDTSPIATVVATTALHKLLETHPERFDEPFEVNMANSSPVRMSCQQDSIKVIAGSSASFTVQLRMAMGWHVNTHTPGNQYAIPLTFNSLDENISLDINWPEGVTMISAGESVEVYSGSVSIPITVTANQSVKEPTKIMVTWQACNEETCLAKETMRVPCTIIVE